MRTTIDIDATVLEELRSLRTIHKKSMGQLVSELLVQALALRHEQERGATFAWTARPMRARLDLSDKALLSALQDGEDYRP